ncbi:GDSL-type esterase/lipase family protein [Sulfurimonas sp. HSL3-7]|uniref:GDSL-type esterase/lipase family protein n=1 Tax=Sulfonitrofixus jiaomeiensis TaxID=3131938 RepID=UPI0031F87B37
MAKQSNLIFLGDSLTDFHDWSVFGEHHNAGIAGDTTDGLLQRLHYTLEKSPECLVLMIGINDLLQGQTVETIKENYLKIFEQLEPLDTVLVLSLLPVQMGPQTFEINEKVILLNHFLKRESNKRGFVYLDLYKTMIDSDGGLKNALTSDGVHLTPEAYSLWESALKAHLSTF